MKGRHLLLAFAMAWFALTSWAQAQREQPRAELLLDPKRTWAIVVGIDNYLYMRNLNYAVADARLMYTTLTDPLGIGLSPDRVFLHLSERRTGAEASDGDRGVGVQVESKTSARRPLRDPAAYDATTESVIRSLDYVLKNAEQGDILIFYFSGHGDSVADDLYLCTLETIVSPEEIRATALSMRQILDKINQSRLKTTLFIVDSCRAGVGTEDIEQLRLSQLPQFRQILQGKTPQQQPGRGIGVQAERSPSLVVPRILALFSARDNQLAHESPELRHGVFTYYLVRALRGGAQGASEFRRQTRTPGRIIFTDLERYLQNTVGEFVFATMGQEQRPTFFPDLQAIGRLEAAKFHPLFGISITLDSSVAPEARVEIAPEYNPTQKLIKTTPCVFSVQELDRAIREVNLYSLRIYPKSLPSLLIEDVPLTLDAPLSIRVFREGGAIAVSARLGEKEFEVIKKSETNFVIGSLKEVNHANSNNSSDAQ